MIKLLKQSLKMKLKELIKILKLNKEVILNSLKIKKAHGWSLSFGFLCLLLLLLFCSMFSSILKLQCLTPPKRIFKKSENN